MNLAPLVQLLQFTSPPPIPLPASHLGKEDIKTHNHRRKTREVQTVARAEVLQGLQQHGVGRRVHLL